MVVPSDFLVSTQLQLWLFFLLGLWMLLGCDNNKCKSPDHREFDQKAPKELTARCDENNLPGEQSSNKFKSSEYSELARKARRTFKLGKVNCLYDSGHQEGIYTTPQESHGTPTPPFVI